MTTRRRMNPLRLVKSSRTRVKDDTMLVGSDNGCAICGPLNRKGDQLAPDPDHRTGWGRGLLRKPPGRAG